MAVDPGCTGRLPGPRFAVYTAVREAQQTVPLFSGPRQTAAHGAVSELKPVNRWKDGYEQGKRDLARARVDLDHEFYEWACFTSQQAAEKMLKAAGYKLGLTLWGHSLSELLGLLSNHVEVPPEILESAQTLDLYYVAARYPNGFPSGKPADYFSKTKAQ